MTSAYDRGYADALAGLRSVAQVSAELGISPSLTYQRARTTGNLLRVGALILLTREHVAALRDYTPPQTRHKPRNRTPACTGSYAPCDASERVTCPTCGRTLRPVVINSTSMLPAHNATPPARIR